MSFDTLLPKCSSRRLMIDEHWQHSNFLVRTSQNCRLSLLRTVGVDSKMMVRDAYIQLHRDRHYMPYSRSCGYYSEWTALRGESLGRTPLEIQDVKENGRPSTWSSRRRFQEVQAGTHHPKMTACTEVRVGDCSRSGNHGLPKNDVCLDQVCFFPHRFPHTANTFSVRYTIFPSHPEHVVVLIAIRDP